MDVALVYAPTLDAYDFGPAHPLRPERVSLAVALMTAYGLVDAGDVGPTDGAGTAHVRGPLHLIAPRAATAEELERVHDTGYLDAVVRASRAEGPVPAERGIGPGDTPAFPDMHEAASLVAGATCRAIEAVTDGTHLRSFSPAGGLHHAHRDRAAGFCVYNDVAVAISAALARDPALRVLYLDIDAHHGDGVQEAFYADPRVLTVSIHENGRYLYPGGGGISERGSGPGVGYALNVPLPPLASDECYRLAFEDVVAPAARHFAPGLTVAQCGADAHFSDPLTSLGVTLDGFGWLYARIVELADDLCEGRLVACGGGGYSWLSIVPRAWTILAATLAGAALDAPLPPSWVELATHHGKGVPGTLAEDREPMIPAAAAQAALEETRAVIARLRANATR